MVAQKLPPDEPDPTLQAVLDGGCGAGFEDARELAIDALEPDDLVAFWVQAIGDGTPLANGPGGYAERATQLQMAHVAGYDDQLTYPAVREIARHLYAHHAGVVSDGSKALDDAEIIGDNMTGFADSVHWLYSDPPDAIQYPKPVALADQVEQAVALLSESDLSLFWLQAIHEADDELTRSQVDPENRELFVDTLMDKSIEFVMGIPAPLDDMAATQRQQLFTIQHHFVTAHTAELSPGQLASDAGQLLHEMGYLHERPTTL